MKKRLYTGSYNAPVLTGDGDIYQGNGKGIQVFLFDEEEGTLEVMENYPDVENASWMAFSPDKKTLYAVNELDDFQGTKGGALSAFTVDENGKLVMKDRLPVMGAAPCHVNCDQSGSHVFIANYSGGSLSSFAVNGDGSLRAMDLQIVYHLEEDRPEGASRARQEKSHVHSVSVFDGYLWVTDLGADVVLAYKLDKTGNLAGEVKDGIPKACHKVALPAGTGPRSLAFGKDGYVYVSCELSNEIGILHWKDDRAELEGFVSSTPEEDDEQYIQGEAEKENFPGGIILSRDGKYLYVGNRGQDNIGVFRIGEAGRPKAVQWIASGGKNPRGFQLSPSGRWLIAANQNSDNMVVFRRDEERGTLTEYARYDAGAVVCLEFL